jgi:basic amino acid/polyamine antiporter, APA family
MSNQHRSDGLVRTLGLPALVFYGVGSMLGAGIYGLIGRAAGVMGSAVWMAFVAAMVAALLTGMSYASLVSRHPRAGGAAYITRRAFKSPLIGYVVGICVLASGLTSMATASNVFADNFVSFNWSNALSPAVVSIGVIVALGLVNFIGLRESAALNTVCTIIEAAGLLLIVAVGLRFWGERNLLEFPPDKAGTVLATGILVMQGAVLTFFSFIGFEDLLNVAEEARDAERTLPAALIIAQLVTVAVYLLVAVTAVSVLPWQELAASKTPLRDVAAHAGSWFPSWLIAAVTCFAVLNTSLLNYVMGSRLIYGMSRDGMLPKPLGILHPTRHTPWLAIILIGAAVVGLRFLDIAQTAAATVLLLLGVFVLMNLSLLRLKRRPGEPTGRFEIPLLIPILGALVCSALILARASTPGSGASLSIAAGIALAAVALYFAMPRARHPEDSPSTTSHPPAE